MFKKIWNGITNFISHNWLIKMLTSIILGGLSLLAYAQSNEKLFLYLSIPFGAFILLYLLIGMIYAWIINPIRDSKDTYKVVRIKKGNHYPGIFSRLRMPILYLSNTHKVTKHFKFTDKSVFDFLGENKFDWNKLFGISFGFHHKNSCRIGFRFVDNQLQFCKYVYIDGVRIRDTQSNICVGDLNVDYTMTIQYSKKAKSVIYEIKGKDDEIIFAVSEVLENLTWWGYSLSVYIGGNLPCPKNIEILKK